MNDSIKKMLESLKGLMQINSTSKDGGLVTSKAPLGEGINEAIDYVLELGKKFGFETKNLDGYCGYVEMGKGEEMIAMLTHVDTVAVGDGWTVPPFDLTIKGDKLMGRGSLDDKGLTIVSLYAMKAIKESGFPLGKRIRLIVGGDEESGDWRCMKRYKETEEMPVLAFSPDAGYPTIFAEKGILNVTIEKKLDKNEPEMELVGGIQLNSVPGYASAKVNGKVYEGFGKLAHASEPEQGMNAILLLIEELKAEGVDHSFIKLGEIATVEGFGIDFSDDISGRLTLNPGIAKVDSQVAMLKCDIRYPVTVKAEVVEEAIKKAVEALGFSVTTQQNVLPLYVDKESFLVQTLQKVYKEQTGDDSEPMAIGGGTYARAFENAVAFGGVFPGDENLCHQTDESWSIQGMEKNFRIIKKVLEVLGN
ncbi:MAG: Sapep family Mn(2+)-dependent dipeptidase [Eubacteriaceae bacterium]